MSKDEEKIIRELSLLTFLLSEKRPRTAKEIQESVEGYWGMSDDTFARRFHGDRADLAKIGIDVQTLADQDTGDDRLYFLTEEDYRLPSIDFLPEEQRALSLALAALDGRFAYTRPLRLALTALCRGVPDLPCSDLDNLPVALAPDEDAAGAGTQLARIEDAVGRGKTVCFKYRSASGAEQERQVDPYSLLLLQGRWYMVGFDRLREAIRTFRLTRIVGPVKFLTEKARDFTVPPNYNPEEYRARPPWLIGGVKDAAAVRVDEGLAWWVSRLQPHVSQTSVDKDGWSTFSVPYADEDVLLSWIVELKHHGRLIHPASLRARLANRLGTLAALHAPGATPGTRADAATETAPKAAPEVKIETAAQTTAVDTILSGKTKRRKTAPIAPEHLSRSIWLMQYLVDERRPDLIPWADLQSDLGLTRAEVEADLHLINLVNFGGGTSVLYAEAEESGIRVTRDPMADVFTHPAHLSPLMVRALLLAFDLLGDTVVNGATALSSMRDKIRQVAGKISAGSIVVDDVMPPASELFESLGTCIRDHLVTEIEYFTPTKDELTTRRIEPYLLFRTRDGWYLEAYCLTAGGQRTFRLEFIRGMKPTAQVFVPRPDVELNHRRTGEPLPPSTSVSWASVRFASKWRSYLEEKGVPYRHISDVEVLARMPYFDEQWPAQEVLRLLGEAVIEQPESARSRVRDLASSLHLLYSDDHLERGAE
jgi:proteasome accessory factor BC